MKLEIRKWGTIFRDIKLIIIAWSSVVTPLFLGCLLFLTHQEWDSITTITAYGSILSMLGIQTIILNLFLYGWFFGKITLRYAEAQLIIEETVRGLMLSKKMIDPKTVTRITFYIKGNDPLAGGLGGRAGRGGHSIPTYDIAIIADKKSQLIFSSDSEAPSRKVFDTLSEWFGWERRDSVKRNRMEE